MGITLARVIEMRTLYDTAPRSFGILYLAQPGTITSGIHTRSLWRFSLLLF